MQKASPSHTLLVCSISNPIMLGVYAKTRLIEVIESSEKTSDALLPLVVEVMKRYELSNIIYVRGPGSFMAIKLTYLILKTVEIVKKIPLQGCSAFALNGNLPIRALGNLYFVKEKETIIMQKFEQAVSQKFVLPRSLADLITDEEATPNYVLAAV